MSAQSREIKLRRALTARLRTWAARRHGADALPLKIHRRRIYIVPTRFGMAFALLLAAMLIAGLNYNSNLALAFSFLMTSVALVAMHHCHRNLLGLIVDVTAESDALAGGSARFEFLLSNEARLARCDIEIHFADGAEAVVSVPARGRQRVGVDVPTARRGIKVIPQFEIRTRHPFGWFRAWTYVQRPLTAFVAPESRGEAALPPATAALGSLALSESRGEEEFAGLRSYEAGVPLKHMAWKVLARGGEPAVRSYSAAGAQPEWLEWSALARLDAEARLSQLCRWIMRCEAARGAYGLRLPNAEIRPSRGARHRRACLRALAAYPGSNPP